MVPAVARQTIETIMALHLRRSRARADLRACVVGAVAASSAAVLFMAGLYVLDVGGIGTLVAKSPDGLSLLDLLLPPALFGLVGFLTGPAVAGRPDRDD